MSTGAIAALAIGLFLVGLLVGAIFAAWLTQRKIKKQLDENPPINEKMIRVMFAQMGRKASETQIKSIMRSMKQAK
ncbi:YneF family protein [Mycoplasma zalophi]|uniref:YneF family protein n=1 Tax=Mycoplasma zalophi TaxID=191287 RepID=A0ABS6DQ38_9MOLU|nr:YneF family protein [Mycoplasma zalophi]MBU4691189.1 YneF family protein [Mycoplasma zalophi]MBU4692037.1 YneF family protein [Mycoplasma zalophi]